jgi:hypothetical protein
VRWWQFIDGHHLRKGVDLMKMFNTEGHYRTMNIIEDILAEEKLRDSQYNGALTKIRTNVVTEYGNMDSETFDDFDIFDESNYTEQTEDGYVGFAPLG